jgi:MFS family permease
MAGSTDEGAVAGEVSQGARYGSLALLTLLVTVSILDRQIISLMIEPMKRDLGVSDFEISLLQGMAFGLLFAFLAMPMGFLVDRFSRRKIIFFGVTCWSIFAISCGLARNYGQLLLCRMGLGIGEATLSPASFSLLASLFQRQHLGLALSIFSTGSAIGAALSFSVGGILVEMLEKTDGLVLPIFGALKSWQAAFVLTGLPGLILAGFVFLVKEPARPRTPASAEAAASKASGFARLMRRHWRYYVCHFLGFGLIFMLAYGLVAWFPVYLIRVHQAPVSLVGLIMASSTIVTTAGFVFSGWLSDRLYRGGMADAHLRYFAVTSLLCAVVGGLFFGAKGTMVFAVCVYLVITFMQALAGVAAGHLQIATPAKFRGRISGIYLLVTNLMGITMGPSLVAFCTDYIFGDPLLVGRSLALTFGVIAPLASVLLWLGFRPARTAVADAIAHDGEAAAAPAGAGAPATEPA